MTGEVSAYLQARWGPHQMPIRVKEERKIGGVGSALSRLGDQCVLQGVGGGSIYHVYLCFKLESFYCVDCRMACVRKRAHIYVCACVGMGLGGGGGFAESLVWLTVEVMTRYFLDELGVGECACSGANPALDQERGGGRKPLPMTSSGRRKLVK